MTLTASAGERHHPLRNSALSAAKAMPRARVMLRAKAIPRARARVMAHGRRERERRVLFVWSNLITNTHLSSPGGVGSSKVLTALTSDKLSKIERRGGCGGNGGWPKKEAGRDERDRDK
jgi:hypothetical protein